MQAYKKEGPQFLQRLVAVSYTHLDVYKRQLLRILLIGYLYGITSERKLVEELRMHLAWRWFTGLGFDQEIPHPVSYTHLDVYKRQP